MPHVCRVLLFTVVGFTQPSLEFQEITRIKRLTNDVTAADDNMDTCKSHGVTNRIRFAICVTTLQHSTSTI